MREAIRGLARVFAREYSREYYREYSRQLVDRLPPRRIPELSPASAAASDARARSPSSSLAATSFVSSAAVDLDRDLPALLSAPSAGAVVSLEHADHGSPLTSTHPRPSTCGLLPASRSRCRMRILPVFLLIMVSKITE